VPKESTADSRASAAGRSISGEEIAALLALDVPARLATLEPNGFPRITPLWFLWQEGSFWMTSLEGQPHLRNLARDLRTAICVDGEEPQAAGGIRPNWQVKGHSLALLRTNERGEWTRRITVKYVRGLEGRERAAARTAASRVVIQLRPEGLIAPRYP
jgi:hypothetical protein